MTRDGLSLWYRIAGRGPALLVPTPGWGASVDMYMKSLTRLQREFTLIYLDTRGAGRSQAPAKGSGYAFGNFVYDLETLRVNLGLDRWLIFAHSDASRQAMEYAIEFPKACHGLFIVGGTTAIEDKKYKEAVAALRKKRSHESWYPAAVRAERGTPRSNDDFRKSFLCVQLPLYFSSYDAAVEAQHYFSQSTYHVIGNEYDRFAPQFGPDTLKEIRVPTAAFVGDGDSITPPLDSDRIVHGISKPKLFTKPFRIKNAGHFPWVEQPKAFFKDFAQAERMIRRAAP
jgi:pimeloyl-ACP methyl ester carboxylesterase